MTRLFFSSQADTRSSTVLRGRRRQRRIGDERERDRLGQHDEQQEESDGGGAPESGLVDGSDGAEREHPELGGDGDIARAEEERLAGRDRLRQLHPLRGLRVLVVVAAAEQQLGRFGQEEQGDHEQHHGDDRAGAVLAPGQGPGPGEHEPEQHALRQPGRRHPSDPGGGGADGGAQQQHRQRDLDGDERAGDDQREERAPEVAHRRAARASARRVSRSRAAGRRLRTARDPRAVPSPTAIPTSDPTMTSPG